MSGRTSLAGVAAVAAAMLVAGASQVAARTPANPRVGCGDVIDQQAPGSLDARVVLGLVAVPPARIQRAAPTGTTSWTHFSKWGMEVHSGTAAAVSVPRAWRHRVAITWGANTPIASALSFAPCHLRGHRSRPWNAYPGGFYINAVRACVPLTITVRRRSRTVRFGIGASCPR
ncbi:MAG: hypothetical protein KGL15_07645 [Acidobacteriota bacterium]|nr:hypothetical protein [Acidobacteriota bacterium]